MTSEGRPYARFRRALEVRSVFQAEIAAREIGRLGLTDALDYLVLLANEAPERYERAARKWLARLRGSTSRSVVYAGSLRCTRTSRARCCEYS
jgi:hypothetical protein